MTTGKLLSFIARNTDTGDFVMEAGEVTRKHTVLQQNITQIGNSHSSKRHHNYCSNRSNDVINSKTKRLVITR